MEEGTAGNDCDVGNGDLGGILDVVCSNLDEVDGDHTLGNSAFRTLENSAIHNCSLEPDFWSC